MKRPHVTLAALLCVLGALGAPRRVEAAVDDASTAVLHTSREGFSPRVELALGMVPGGGVVILVDHARTGRTTWDDIALAAFDVATLPLNVQWFIDGYRALRWGLRALDLVETACRGDVGESRPCTTVASEPGVAPARSDQGSVALTRYSHPNPIVARHRPANLAHTVEPLPVHRW